MSKRDTGRRYLLQGHDPGTVQHIGPYAERDQFYVAAYCGFDPLEGFLFAPMDPLEGYPICAACQEAVSKAAGEVQP